MRDLVTPRLASSRAGRSLVSCLGKRILNALDDLFHVTTLGVDDGDTHVADWVCKSEGDEQDQKGSLMIEQY